MFPHLSDITAACLLYSLLRQSRTNVISRTLLICFTFTFLSLDVTFVMCFLFQVTPYHFTMNNVQITVFDTPGLADGTGNEEGYLRKIKEGVTDPCDMFIFCTEMNSRRFRNDDIKTVEMLTATFGAQLWEHAVVALTFANEVLHPNKDATQEERLSLFNERMRCFKKTIQDVLLKVGVAEKVVINVPFVATGVLCEPCLPGITNWQTAFWIATFKRLDKSARFPFLILNKDRLKISSAEPDVQAKERPLRRSLPPQEAEGAPQRRQRRSFHGFELVNREQDSGYEPDSDPDTEFRTKSRSLPVKTSKIPPKTKPKPKKGKMQQDTSTIDIDEAAAAEVVLEFISEVGEGASRLAGEYIHPGAGDVFQTAFRWIIRLLKRLFQRNSSKEDARDEDEDEVDQEAD